MREPRAAMKGRLTGLLLSSRSCSSSSSLAPASRSLSNGTKCIAAVQRSPTCSRFIDKASPPSTLDVQPFPSQYALHSRSAKSSKFQYPLHSCSPYFSHLPLCCTSAQSYATISNATIWQKRRFADSTWTKRENPRCWSCDQETSSESGLFCSSCKAIQPLDPSVDFFKLFSIARSFKLDLKVLEQSYKELQKKLHPDLASSKSQREQGFSAEQSAHVIQAYYILLRPLSRARYLLGIHGIKVEEEGTINDPELLMQIMEIRESIEEASDAKELEKARAGNNERILQCEKALESSFKYEDLAKAVSWVQRLSYYIKVGEEILRKL